jgi:hypothetical protein
MDPDPGKIGLTPVLTGKVRPCRIKALAWGCSSAGRVPDWQSGGHEFDPRQLHQSYQ